MNQCDPQQHVKMLADYFALMSANGASQVYRTAMEMGVLDALANGPCSLDDLAESCDVQPRPVALMVEALRVMGLVTSNDSGHQLTPLGGSLRGGTYRQLGDQYWLHLPALLKTGEPLHEMDDARQSESHYQSQAMALAWMLGPAAEVAAKILLQGSPGKKLNVLDIGAGSAVWSLAIARHESTARVTAADWPAVLAVAEQFAVQQGLGDRLQTIPGNVHDTEWPHEWFDIAIIGNVTHLESEQGNLDLFKRAYQSLKPGGEVVIFDIFPGDPRGDLHRTLYELGLALRTKHGTLHASNDLARLLGEAGFTCDPVNPLDAPPFAVGMLRGRRE